MSLKILIADDSMTAQNMGKKILADAGFDVVPVSNGAAAVKKIAETKPDIIILDIFMPGYTGLEVCDKVKSAPETSNVPVLLTVGKLEPYRPEDGAKVRAEGVIIKPFEASDLLSAVAKIAEKYNLSVPQIDPVEVAPVAAAPAAVASIATHAPQQVTGYAAAASFAAAEPEPYKPEVPSFIREATAAAAAPAPMFIIEETPEEAPLPSFDLSDLGSLHEATAQPMEEAAPASVEEAPLPFTASSVPDPTASGRWFFGSSTPAPAVEPMLDTVAKSEAATATDPELETTAAAKVEGEVESLIELEATPEAPFQVETAADPSLVTSPDELMQFTIKVGTEQEDIPAENDPFSKAEGSAPQASEEVAAPVEQAVGDDTAEIEVPSAQHSYQDDPMVQMGAISIEPEPEPVVEIPAPAPEVGDDTMRLSLAHSSGLEGALHEFEATEEPEEETIVLPEVQAPEHFAPEHHEAIAAAAAESYVEPEVVVEPVADATPEFHEPYAEPAAHEVEATVAAAMETAVEQQQDTKTLAAAAGLDPSQVARAVQRVFERYREQMVADITDELSKGE